MPLPMRWRDLAALVLAAGAAVAGVVVWLDGSVTLGMKLHEEDGTVRVSDVTPDGHAAHARWNPGIRLLDVTTVDGTDVARGERLRVDSQEIWAPYETTFNPFELLLGTMGGPLAEVDPHVRPPTEAVDPELIQTAVGGEVDPDTGEVYVFAGIDRALLELNLRSSIWIVVFGAALGLAVWRLLVHGIADDVGRQHAGVLGAAAAAPFLILPVVAVGTTPGIVAGYVVPATAALLVGLSLARLHPERSWAQTATMGSLITAGLAAVLLTRYMTSSTLVPRDQGGIVLMIAAIAVVPAAVVAAAKDTPVRQRVGIVSLSLIPAAAHTVIGPRPDVVGPAILIGLVLGWQVVPFDRVLPALGHRLSGDTPAIPSTRTPDPGSVAARTRDTLLLALLGGSVLLGLLAGGNTWAVIIGLGLAGIVWIAVRSGFLGPSWTDAAVPLAAAVGVPVALAAFGLFDSDIGWVVVPISLTALAVAHLLAGRLADPVRADRVVFTSGAIALFACLSLLVGASELGVLLAGTIPFAPGLALVMAPTSDDARGVSNRLDTAAVALTPAVATTALISVGYVILAAWALVLIVSRSLTLTPLMRFAARTQLQRDVAVAAAETERARLAADLHDDALQQLTMLVRTLDERGDKEGADEAREIANKLRSVVGDLRLPILDDLGAGAALEWLVERVEPLAGGPVKLERSDDVRPPATVELAVFRVAQEALTNAIKHGRPPIAIRYDVRADGRVTLAIDDAGEGIGVDAAEEAPRQGHFGLVNMQQRAEQIGALLDVRRWPGGGTRVALEWRPQ